MGNRALLIIDVQNEYITGKLPVTYPADSIDNIMKAAETANNENVDIVVIQHTAPQQGPITFDKGSAGWELHPKIKALKVNHYCRKDSSREFYEY